MALSALLLTFFGQDSAVGNPVFPDLNTPLTVVEPNRLAITPKLDGLLGEEEWDPLSDTADSKAYLQWEPGRLYVAGTVPKGHDLVFSLDAKNDGWLRGKDNVEVRAKLSGSQVLLTARLLDNTGKEGPVWQALPTVVQASQAAATESEAGILYELSLADSASGPLAPQKDARWGVRYDVLPSDSIEVAAFLPRAMNEIRLVTQRSAGMPSGLTTAIQDDFQTVVPGENMRMRLTFRGSNTLQIQKLDLRSEGDARDRTLALSTPFMVFDSKGRAFYDYDTRVTLGPVVGYRVMRGTIVAGDGLEGVVQGSYRIAPLVDFQLLKPTWKTSDAAQTARLPYRIKSNSVNRVIGGVSVLLPEGWRNLGTEDKGYIIHFKNTFAERFIDLEIPGGTKGTFPIRFRNVLGDQLTEQTVWLTVQ